MNFYLLHRIFPSILLFVAATLFIAVISLPQIFVFIEVVLKDNNRGGNSYRYYRFVALALAIVAAATGFVLFVKN